METFLIKPFFCIILTTISCSVLGVFVLWKKLAYFGDSLSHSILLGLVIGAIFNVNQILVLTIFATFFASLLGIISKNRFFSKDSLIVIASYFCVASAMLINDFQDFRMKNFSFNSYIFGDALSVGNQELYALMAIAVMIIAYIIFAFRKLLLIAVDEDLARIENIKTTFWNLSFTILLAVTIALSVRIVGVFLMTSLLILPAAISRIFSTSAKQMLLISLCLGAIISAVSFKIAEVNDLTISSTIVAIFSLIFFTSLTLRKFVIRNS